MNKKFIYNIDIVEELQQYGIDGYISNNNYMHCCLFHGETNPSAGIVVDIDSDKYGVFNCFGCGASGDFFDIIAEVKGVSRQEVCSLYNKNLFDPNKIEKFKKKLKKAFEENQKEVLKSKKKSNIKYIKVDYLDKFVKPYGDYLKYLKSRKINVESIERHNILCCDNKKHKFFQRIIIPIYNDDNKLVSVTARSIIKDIDKLKKVRKLVGTDSKKILFGSESLVNFNCEYLILCEGEFDSIYLQQNGFPAVALQSITISQDQVKQLLFLISQYNYRFILILLDGDQEDANLIKLKHRIQKFIQTFIYTLHEIDPNDMRKADFDKLGKYIETLRKRVVW